MSQERKRAGFKDRTRVAPARDRLLETVTPLSRTESVPVAEADGRVLATAAQATRPVPHYARAAMDGFAVRAEDTFGASDRSPVRLEAADAVGPNRATRVHTGSELPEGADAVVMVEQIERREETLEVFDAVAGGENVAPVGEDVSEGEHLYDPGHRLRPSDLGLLKSVGDDAVEVFERPRVSVVPTGEELVQSDPAPGEVIETNGQTVAQYVSRWGGDPTYRSVVSDDPDALEEAITRDLDHNIVVTTGGSSVGERDLLPEVVADLGEVLVHGVALKPGHPFAFGRVEATPVLMLPGYPVAAIVNAVQFLRPALKRVGHCPQSDFPTTEARLTRKVTSEPGTRSFVRVELDDAGNTSGTDDAEDSDDEGDADGATDATDGPTATPTRASGAGVLSSVALADGWVVVPEGLEGYDAGTTVTVENWEWSA